jgi:hypothetical protein
VDDPHRVRSQTSLGTLSQKTTHPGRRQGSQPNRAETPPDMHPHSVRVVPPRGWPKPCPRHSLQPVIGIRAHCPRLPRRWDPRRRLRQQNRQLLAGLGPRPPVHLSTDSPAVRAKHIRGSRPSPILAKIDRQIPLRSRGRSRHIPRVSELIHIGPDRTDRHPTSATNLDAGKHAGASSHRSSTGTPPATPQPGRDSTAIAP